MRMTLDLLHVFANTEVFCLFHNCVRQSRDSEVNVYVLALCEQTGWLFIKKNLPVLTLSASTFLSASLSWSKRSTDTGTQLFTGLPCIHWCFRRQTRHLCRFPQHSNRMVALPKLVSCSYNWIWGLWVGFCWESSPPPATSEPNSFIQLSLKEIFGGGRGDAYTFSTSISPDSIIIAFGIQWAWSVSWRIIAFDRVW